jgi:hypothetical protein
MMDYGKYIIVESCGNELAIIFDCCLNHSDFLKMFDKEDIIAAGMFAVYGKPSKDNPCDISVSSFNKSVTLGISSREEDSELIKRVMQSN